jgi:predicted oxidoreductase
MPHSEGLRVQARVVDDEGMCVDIEVEAVTEVVVEWAPSVEWAREGGVATTGSWNQTPAFTSHITWPRPG